MVVIPSQGLLVRQMMGPYSVSHRTLWRDLHIVISTLSSTGPKRQTRFYYIARFAILPISIRHSSLCSIAKLSSICCRGHWSHFCMLGSSSWPIPRMQYVPQSFLYHPCSIAMVAVAK